MDFRLKHPFTMLLSGPSMSGKTTLVYSLLNTFTLSTNIDKTIENIRIIWVSREKPNTPSSISSLISHFSTLTSALKLIEEKSADVIVIDDLMAELSNDVRLSNLFTRDSHHKQISCILLTQNLFYKSQVYRTVSLNAKYIVLTKTVRDLTQIELLGRQLFPKNQNLFLEAYKYATVKPYGYLLLDLTQETPESLRLRSDTFASIEKSAISPTVYQFENV